MGDEYKAVEKRLLAAIHLRFGLPAENSAAFARQIKRADRVSAYFEAVELAGFADREAAKFFGRPRGFSAGMFELEPQSANQAQRSFLKAFRQIEPQLGSRA